MLRLVLVMGLAAGASIAGALTAGSPAGAAVNGHCGDLVVGALHAGQNLREGGVESPDLHVYSERTNFKLTAGVAVDFRNVGLYNRPINLPNPKPALSSATVVNSYLVHSDPPGQPAKMLRTATLGFTSNIIGVQILGATLTATNAHQLRFPGVNYPNAVSGLELSTTGNGDFAHLINPRTLAISFKTSNAVDDVRVITAGTASTATALKGYRMLAADGGVFDFGGQQFFGSTGGRVLNQPVVAGANTCGNAGYWFVARDGGIFSYGDAIFHGSLGGQAISAPVVGMAATPTGGGYYLVLANGEVHAYGDAVLFNNSGGHHDLSGLHLNKPIVGMTATPSGHGYWLVASDGGIFAFGDAPFYGSTGNIHLVSPIIGMYAALDGRGYYLYAADGGMFVFQQHSPVQVHEPFFGSAGGAVRANPIVGARLAADGQGYWFADSAGLIFNFGPSAPRATPVADMSGVKLFRPMIGMM
jgi:hypothetical protein